MNVVSRDKGALRRIIREAVLIKNALREKQTRSIKLKKEYPKTLSGK